MDGHSRNSRSGGVLLALAIVAGVVGGAIAGQPSLGFLIGAGVGLLLLGLVWAVDRRR